MVDPLECFEDGRVAALLVFVRAQTEIIGNIQHVVDLVSGPVDWALYPHDRNHMGKCNPPLAQFFQTVQGYSPLKSGLLILPWTAMPIIVAPIAGALSDRIGGGRIMAVGLTLQAAGLLWIASVSTPTVPYAELVVPFVLSGVGMALFFAPVANVVLGAVHPREEGQASGAANAIRELGGVFGVAVLASIFASYGGYETSATFSDGLNVAVYVGGAIVAVGALAAFFIPRRRKQQPEVETLVPELEAAA